MLKYPKAFLSTYIIQRSKNSLCKYLKYLQDISAKCHIKSFLLYNAGCMPQSEGMDESNVRMSRSNQLWEALLEEIRLSVALGRRKIALQTPALIFIPEIRFCLCLCIDV